jgi:hypothetical protein
MRAPEEGGVEEFHAEDAEKNGEPWRNDASPPRLIGSSAFFA